MNNGCELKKLYKDAAYYRLVRHGYSRMHAKLYVSMRL